MAARVLGPNPRRSTARLVAALLLAITLLSVPGAFLIEPTSAAAALGLALACLATAAASAFVPWERLPATVVGLAPAAITIEAAVAIAVLDPVYGFVAVIVAAGCAYGVGSARVAAGHVAVAVLALIVPALLRPSASAEVLQAALLLTPLTVVAALVGAYVRERTEATALAYEAFASDALELATRIHTSVTGETPVHARNGAPARRRRTARARSRSARALRFPPAHGDPLLPALGSLAAAVLAISLIVIDPGVGDEVDAVGTAAPLPIAIELDPGDDGGRVALARDRSADRGAAERDRREHRPLGASAEETIASADDATSPAPATRGGESSSGASSAADPGEPNGSAAQSGSNGEPEGSAGGEPDVARENDPPPDSPAPTLVPQSSPEPPPNLLDVLEDTLGLPHSGG